MARDKSREMRAVIVCPCGEVTDVSDSPGGALFDAWWVCEKCGLHYRFDTHLKARITTSEGIRFHPL